MHDNIHSAAGGPRPSRQIVWVKAARKAFDCLPEEAQLIFWRALTVAAEGGKADVAKPMTGLGSGVFEIAVPHRGNAFRAVYAVQLADEIWVVHAFQKKSKQGVKTPTRELDLIRARLRSLRGTHS